MNPLSALYGAAVRARNHLYDGGMLKAAQLRGPVVSIGNITVGGSGKTPFLILLGQLLQRNGIAFDVLSRGYRRQSKGVALVDPQGSAPEFGDEPLLIARKLGVPVIVGEDRFAAGTFAEKQFGPQLHLLDDGFQHRRLARELDIVLVTATDARDSLLPAGRLREPVSSLSRADVIVLTDSTWADDLGQLGQHVWRVQRGVAIPNIDGPCVAFCGIARPENFFEQLRTAGVHVVATRAFRDHHTYTEADVQQLLKLRQQHGGAAFVTTEKDEINLAPHRCRLEPLHVAAVRMELEDAEAAMHFLLSRIAERTAAPS